ncbi:MAG TPA: hypothetical protein VJA82_05570 [Sediminibacterium sp.]|uniref:hypothetical protein n=1 Tax=Sediminibacterium sp. TaxID=1917865 RepID=UPI002B4B32E0|nr:hypothetical protein [Sediminibacterium sp.]HLD52748.1 hypothetical protein [Sediminibacterium sp.]
MIVAATYCTRSMLSVEMNKNSGVLNAYGSISLLLLSGYIQITAMNPRESCLTSLLISPE